MKTKHSSFSHHPRSRFDSYLENSLSPGSRRRMQRHLTQCQDCAHEISQRATALRISRSVSSSSPPDGPPASGQDSVAVLEKRRGVAGWKLVLFLGVVCVVAIGMLVSAWVIGGRSDSAIASQTDPALLPQELHTNRSAEEPSRAVSADPSSTAQSAVDDPQGPSLVSGPEDVSTADLSAHGTDLAVTALPQLRNYGWNIPGLAHFGLSMESAAVQTGSDWAEVSTLMRRSDPDGEVITVVRECRHIDEDGTVVGCPIEAPSGAPVSTVGIGADTNIEVQTFDDGTWSARLHTEHASYRVDSSDAVERASGMMSALKMTEEARIQDGSLPDTTIDRLVRGFQQLVPGTN